MFCFKALENKITRPKNRLLVMHQSWFWFSYMVSGAVLRTKQQISMSLVVLKACKVAYLSVPNLHIKPKS